ncbi:MAG: insulinase family protein, partial [Deltaproteobacteria bacterium]|nr:insulinase family protein [Deltaproteobacteria bacterium]
MFAKTVLDNGIRIVSHEMPDHRSLSLGIWVENGSRHETRNENGISHFIEHLLFKGTDRRSAAQIAEEVDAVGGVINAFTSKEHTCYYAKVLDENLPLAIDLLSDIFLHSKFDAEEIERERSVILQEISQTEDTPDDYVHDLFSLDFFRDHSIGRPICGSAKTVNRFNRDDFLRFFRTRYRPRRVIVAAAGHLRHSDIVTEMAVRLGSISDSRDGEAAELLEGDRPPELRHGIFTHPKTLEQ